MHTHGPSSISPLAYVWLGPFHKFCLWLHGSGLTCLIVSGAHTHHLVQCIRGRRGCPAGCWGRVTLREVWSPPPPHACPACPSGPVCGTTAGPFPRESPRSVLAPALSAERETDQPGGRQCGDVRHWSAARCGVPTHIFLFDLFRFLWLLNSVL